MNILAQTKISVVFSPTFVPSPTQINNLSHRLVKIGQLVQNLMGNTYLTANLVSGEKKSTRQSHDGKKKWEKNIFCLQIACNCWCALFKDPATTIDALIVEIHCCREEITTRTCNSVVFNPNLFLTPK
jgi:hypothetical protein